MRKILLTGFFFLLLQAGLLAQFTVPDGDQAKRTVKETEAPTPTPGVDRLALPALPEHPSQVEIGSSLYYFNCMPCHGDQGQGLTDEWREVWEEDHQDCWASGCHSSKDQDKAFTIPTIIPPVRGTVNFTKRFTEPEKLYEYLRQTHPPQHPGILKDEEYWALTAYLLANNGVISADEEIGPEVEMQQRRWIIAGASGAVGIFVITLLFIRKLRKVKPG